MSRALTTDECMAFDYITSGSPHLALLNATMDGEEIACIVHIEQDEDGNYKSSPLAVVLTEEMKDLLLLDGMVLST